tara:strand:+ start:165 stop:422 length:258 start_codon:yes stop_codon:yes gene_type:complete
MKKENMPEKTFRTGVISATVWHNFGQNRDGGDVTFKTVSFQRRYCDDKGEWHSTKTLRVSDLPKAALILDEAYKYLSLKEIDAFV